MSLSYADKIDKLVEGNYFHWEFPQIIMPEFNQVSGCMVAWKTNDLKALGVIAGDVSLTYQVYVRGALTAAEAWTMLEEHFNKETLKNRRLVTKKLNNFKMEPGTKFASHVDQFKEIVLQMETIGATLDETRQLVLLLGSLMDDVTVYFMKAKSEVLSKFKTYKAGIENATAKTIKRLRSDNGGEYTGSEFKVYLNRNDIKHEKTVPYTPQQNGLAERMNRSLVEMARCMLYHESVDRKWWGEAVNTAAWIINRIPNSVNVKTPYEIVSHSRPQLKNVKVFGALGYAHIPNEKRRMLDAKAFKCRFLGYEDGVKGYRVLNLSTGKVQIVRTVKFIETADPARVMTRVDTDEDADALAPTMEQMSLSNSTQIVPTQVEVANVIPLPCDVSLDTAMVPYDSTHPMITRSGVRHIDETTDPEEASTRKKQVIDASIVEWDEASEDDSRATETKW